MVQSLDMLENLLTDDEAADILGVKARTLREWRRRGVGPEYVKLEGWLVRYTEPALAAWLERQTVDRVAGE